MKSGLINFATLAGGAVEEKLQYALAEVAANIADPNTDPKKVRKITMTMTIKPNEQRTIADVAIDVKTTLAAPVGISTTIMIDRDEKGKAVAAEIYGTDPNQGTLEFDANTSKVTPIAERR